MILFYLFIFLLSFAGHSYPKKKKRANKSWEDRGYPLARTEYFNPVLTTSSLSLSPILHLPQLLTAHNNNHHSVADVPPLLHSIVCCRIRRQQSQPTSTVVTSPGGRTEALLPLLFRAQVVAALTGVHSLL